VEADGTVPRVSGRQRGLRLSVAAVTLALLVAAARAHAFTCEATDGTGCPVPGSTCFAGCDEADLRSAIALLNGCPANPEGSEVTIAMGPDLATSCGAVPIPLAMAPTAPAVAAGACGDDNANRYNALCLAGTGVVLDGRGAIFAYAGDQICASCDGECTVCPGGPCANRQPALVVLRGARNTVRNLEMRFFPEGIQITQGDGHVVEHVTGRYVCEDAVTVNGGTGHRIADNVLVGDTDGVTGGGTCYSRIEGSTCTGDGNCPAGARCYCGEVSRFGSCATPSPPPIWPAATPGQCYRPSRCGLDKAIQVNGGESTIERNRIDTLQQPVHVDAGTHTIADNLTCGSHVDPNACQAYDVSGGVVTLRSNRINRCKFGIRVVDGGAADAVDNVITNGWVSAFQVKGTGGAALRGAGNRVRNAGAFTGSDCQRGALVAIGDPMSRVDFGGGDASGAAVFGGDPSPGGNVFCQRQSDGSSLTHVWNVTDCACALNASCSCSMASDAFCGSMCPFAAPCCRLEADGACQGSLGQDASVGVGSATAANAFDPLPVVFPATPPNLVDRMPIHTRIESATAFATCHTIVVDECECLGRPDGTACNDGDACSATDVCVVGICIGTNRPVCNASDQCHVAGICDALTGSCSDPAKPDGSACEDGVVCTAGDTCQAGVCIAGGPGPDRDGDGICDGDDGCPDAADPTQSDLDGDGIGDACDVVDAPLELTHALLRRRGARGTVALRGSFVVQGAADAFAAAAAITVRIRNGGAVDEESAWAPADCRANERRIVCKAKTAHGRFVVGEGNTYRFRIKLAQVVMGPAFDASVGVVLTHGAHIDRVGSLTASACKQRRTRLRCRL
jgi:hypothetical protein